MDCCEKERSPTSVDTGTTLHDSDLEAGGAAVSRGIYRGPPLSPRGRLIQRLRHLRVDDQAGEDPGEAAYKPITRKLDICPDGYSKIATFQSSDPSFLQYRGFSYLHCRLLSSLQYEVEQLERELDWLDTWEQQRDDPEGRLRSKDIDDQYVDPSKVDKLYVTLKRRCRPQVFALLRCKLLEYDEVLLKTREMSALQKPSRRDYESVKAWFMKNEPVVRQEQEFVRRKEDLVSLRSGRESGGFEGLVERVLSRTDRCLQAVGCNLIRKVFVTPELREKTSDSELVYYAPSRVDTLVGAIITIIIFIMLVLPVFVMYALSDLGTRASAFEAISMLILFTLLFGFAMSLLTKARRHELFAASAAYCGVLVVFIGNFSTQSVIIES